MSLVSNAQQLHVASAYPVGQHTLKDIAIIIETSIGQHSHRQCRLTGNPGMRLALGAGVWCDSRTQYRVVHS